jgi:MYXO-CTERM domain-containing protein
VDVSQTATTLGMTPSTPSVAAGGTLSFNMTAMDQFGAAMTGTGTTWTASGDGSISSSGVFTAGAQAGTATVVVTLGSLDASTVVTVTGTGTGTTTGTGPTVTFVAPTLGASVSGMISVQAAVADTAPLKWVTFGIDGTAISVSTGPTFEAMYDTKLLPNGPHTFTAMALDHNGAMGNATTEVMFNNPGSPTATAPAAGCGVAGGTAPWGLLGLAFYGVRRRRRA